jgi:hypothetical protein
MVVLFKLIDQPIFDFLEYLLKLGKFGYDIQKNANNTGSWKIFFRYAKNATNSF